MSIEERLRKLRVETEGNVTVLSGPAGCGKTYAALQQLDGVNYRRSYGSWLCLGLDETTVDARKVARAVYDTEHLLVEECTLDQIREFKKLAKDHPSKTFIFTTRA